MLPRTVLAHVFFLSCVLIIAAGPLVYKIHTAPADTTWSGVYHAITDYFSYLSFLRQGKTQWVQINQMTTEYVPPYVVHIYYLLVGKLGAILPLTPIHLYYVSLFLPLVLYYGMSYAIVRLIVPRNITWAALALVAFSGPIPRRITLFGHTLFTPEPLMWVAERQAAGLDAYGRWTTKPHYFAGLVCTLMLMYWIIRFYRNQQMRYAVYATICAVVGILLYVVPVLFFLAAFFLTLALDILMKWYRGKKFPLTRKLLIGYLICLCIPACVLFFMNKVLSGVGYVYQENTLYTIGQWENIVYSYLPYSLLNLTIRYTLVYAHFFVLFPFAFAYLRKRFSFEHGLLLMMYLVPFALSFLAARQVIGLPYLRFFFQTQYLALALIASYAWLFFWERRRSVLWAGVGIFLCVSLIGQSVWSLADYWVPEFKTVYFIPNGYIPNKYFPALTFLDMVAPPYSNVMASFNAGMLVEAFTNQKTFIASEVGTRNYSEKYTPHVMFMWATMDPAEVRSFLLKYNISYVFWDTGADWTKYQKYLKPVYDRDGIFVFKVLY